MAAVPKGIIWLAPFLLMLLTPVAGVKLLLGCASIALFRFAKAPNRAAVSAGLCVLFFFAYLLSPYWLLLSDHESRGLGVLMPETPARLLALLFLAAVGMLWSRIAAGERIRTNEAGDHRFRELPWALLLAGVLLLCHWKAFHGVIPIHTDEDYHISRMIAVRDALSRFFSPGNAAVAAVTAVAVLGALFRPKRIPPLLRISAVPLLLLALSIVLGPPDYLTDLADHCARYPLVSAWLHQVGLFWDSNRYQEAFYRMAPMLGTFGVGYAVLRTMRKQQIHPLVAVVAGAGVALSPGLSFFSTILYLEVPAIGLILITMYYLEELLTLEFDAVKTHPAWVAWITLGFLKETLFAMVSTMILLRLLIRTYLSLKAKMLTMKSLLRDAEAAFCAALPLALYLVFRMLFSAERRQYHFQLKNLWVPELWQAALLSLWEQFGPVLIVAVIGALVGWYRHRRLWVGALFAVFTAHFLFHFCGKPELVGYARFQLFLLGPLAALCMYALAFIGKRHTLWCAAATAGMLVGNLLLNPVDIVSGGKRPGWACRRSPYYSERYYPYREAVTWLKAHGGKTPVVVGSTHPASLGFEWACRTADYRPRVIDVPLSKNKQSRPNVLMPSLNKTLGYAARRKAPLAMFYRIDDTILLRDDEKSRHGYTALETVSNKYQAIVFYRKDRRDHRNTLKKK